jgi:hypothetical protein
MWLVLGRRRRDRRRTTSSPAKPQLPGDAALSRAAHEHDFRSVRARSPEEHHADRVGSGTVRRRSWIWTVGRGSGVCAVMDNDTATLIQELCTRAGMIMEDVSVEALTISGTDQADIEARLMSLVDGANDQRADRCRICSQPLI